MKLIINRKKWARGDEKAELLNDRGMCCLGFYCKAKGLSDMDIESVGEPACLLEVDEKSAERVHKKLTNLLTAKGKNNKVCEKLMTWNDKIDISEERREEKISYWFKKIDVDVKFMGKGKPDAIEDEW